MAEGVNGDHDVAERHPHPHRRHDDTPPRGIRITKLGIEVPWIKIMGIVTLLGSVATPVGAVFLAKSHLDLGAKVQEGSGKTDEKIDGLRLKTDEKLDRLLDGVSRLERRQESFEERQRQTELDVAALKAQRGEKDRPR